jgi:hypothetical protein
MRPARAAGFSRRVRSTEGAMWQTRRASRHATALTAPAEQAAGDELRSSGQLAVPEHPALAARGDSRTVTTTGRPVVKQCSRTTVPCASLPLDMLTKPAGLASPSAAGSHWRAIVRTSGMRQAAG